MSNSDNKSGLYQFLAQTFILLHAEKTQVLVVTYNETSLTNQELLLSEPDISNCTAEEADPRMIRHAINQAKRWYTDITIRTVDSDVFVLAVAHVHLMVKLGATQVFVHHSKSNETSEYNVIESSSMLGHDQSLTLPFFHSFTGCDTTSSVFQKGKLSFWNAWIGSKNDELTQTFIQLSNLPPCVTERHQNIRNLFDESLFWSKV